MNIARTRLNTVTMSMLLIAMAICSGCKSVHWSKADFNRPATEAKKKGNPVGVPEEMAVIWRDAVYEAAASSSARGFGGRFYFYDKELNPIRVEGELVIYGFDDSGSANSTEADRKFVFKPENLESHFSETALGASYSFWIPWDPVGGERRSISLIPVFKTLDGKIVQGNQSVNILPGKVPEGEKELAISTGESESAVKSIATSWKNDKSANQVAHFDEANTNVVMTRESRQTTTINVPPETAQRFQAGMTGKKPAATTAPASTSGLQPIQTEISSRAKSDRPSSDEARKLQREKSSYFRPWPGINESEMEKTAGTGQ